MATGALLVKRKGIGISEVPPVRQLIAAARRDGGGGQYSACGSGCGCAGHPQDPDTPRTTQDPGVPSAKPQHQVQRAEDATGAQQRVGQADTHAGVVRELPL